MPGKSSRQIGNRHKTKLELTRGLCHLAELNQEVIPLNAGVAIRHALEGGLATLSTYLHARAGVAFRHALEGELANISTCQHARRRFKAPAHARRHVDILASYHTGRGRRSLAVCFMIFLKVDGGQAEALRPEWAG